MQVKLLGGLLKLNFMYENALKFPFITSLTKKAKSKEDN